ncbi:outer membrane biogenesis protein BamB [Anatilimnocola aggregata]|uniref:Outer membrane biogenesis protein BamB n=1 Tax=Anatilimnocola aggregata TaxID=2528021 RepID=A0A517Y4U7_9BACT|nr:PQQ-binding-like beta-propeller repeat protein [Anatilimnocola aggregata]QDU25257.1 outer membrane biogenesis protein BamB [Anatilimnocola aggregata]
MTSQPSILFAAAIVCASVSNLAAAENWPQWRGPNGTGVSSERDLAIVWHEDRGLFWKTPLPEWGTSTPAVWGESIFLTSHTGDGKLLLLKLNKKDGKIVWQQDVGTGEAVREAPKRLTQKFHQLHNLATPSPVTDGTTVVAHFGNGDLAAYDYDGKQLWKRNLQEEFGGYTIWWGHANSPVIFKDMVISVCMQDSLADLQDQPVQSYLVAHDLLTGKQRWKTPRMTRADSEQSDSYTTPLLTTYQKQLQLIVMGGNQLDGYDPANGKQLWFLPGLVGGRTVTGPTVAGDFIYTTRGQRGPLLAVQPRKAGENDFKSIEWDYKEGTPDSCTPVVWNELLFTVADDGIARCIHAPSGNLRWKERLKGKYKASPVAVDGRVLFLNTEGLCTVVSAQPRFDKLVENQLNDETIASPAISDGRIYLRGKQFLYCIGKR